MAEINIDSRWEELRLALSERKTAEKKFKLVRETIVSRLCTCYREGEEWEERAVTCAVRILKQCPYYLEYVRRTI